MITRTAAACLVAAIVFLADVVRAELKAGAPAKPMPASVVLTEKFEKIAGDVVKYDAEGVTFKLTKGERTVTWDAMTPQTAYVLRSRLVDVKSAPDWLDLAEFCAKGGMREAAKEAVARAVRIDPATRLKGDAILRLAPNGKTPTTFRSGQKFQKATPEEHAKALEEAKKQAAIVADKMDVKWTEIQTAHFIVFTDWDPREHDFLKTNVEKAYALVSKQFDIPVRENVFVGKLPVFMFDKQQDFMKFAVTMDGFPASRGVAGYFTNPPGEMAHMAMWKPNLLRYDNLKEAEREWASTLTHEFTHAFVSRYRTDRRIPRWLNEGLAEVISKGEFPDPEAYAFAKMMAYQDFKFENLFNDNMMPGGAMYPVMQTMVEALIKESRKGFLAMFDDIKDGMDPEEALKKHYKAGYRDWDRAWRRYARNLKPAGADE